MRKLYFGLLSATLLSALPTKAAEIDWRVQHQFRFFEAKADGKISPYFEMYKAAWKEINQNSNGRIAAIEAKLNHGEWLQDYYDDNFRQLGIKSDAYRANRAGGAQAGWSRWIVANNATCWSQKEQWHSSCKVDQVPGVLRTDYVRPQRHTIIAQFKPEDGAKIGSNTLCQWSSTASYVFRGYGSSKSITVKCSKSLRMRIPFNPDPITGVSQGLDVTVKRLDTEKTHRQNITIRDKLIVGIGDSFSSGEGNPDVPALMVEGKRVDGRARGVTAVTLKPNGNGFERVKNNIPGEWFFPERNGGGAGAAKWLDRSCHRSLYSYHTRIALQAALEAGPHGAITFLAYACSGAKISEGVLLDYEGVEAASGYSAAGQKRRDKPQLHRLIEELCRDNIDINRTKPVKRGNSQIRVPVDGNGKTEPVSVPVCGNNKPSDYLRPIDLLIVSISGNDVGFANLVARTMLGGRGDGDLGLLPNIVRGLANSYKGHGLDVANAKFATLGRRFEVLVQALEASGLTLKTHRKDAKTYQNVMMTAFPKLHTNEDREICGKTDPAEKFIGNSGTKGIAQTDSLFLQDVAAFGVRINRAVEKFAESSQGAKKPWVFIDRHENQFRGHGFCAQKRSRVTQDRRFVQGPVGSPRFSEVEMMVLPAYLHTSRLDRRRNLSGWRQNISAASIGCYRKQQRWIRTFDDAYLCANTIHLPWGDAKDEGDILLQSLGGAIHPTAEGHSHIADAVWNEIKARKILAK